MAKAYSEDMRERVVNKRQQGKEIKEIMEELQVSKTFVYSVLRNYQLTDQVTVNRKKAGRKRILTEGQLENIRQMIVNQPDSTLEEIKVSLDSPFWGTLFSVTYNKNVSVATKTSFFRWL